jgi:hypothetical protein
MHRIPTALLTLALLLGLAPSSLREVAAQIRCTPTTVQVGGSPARQSKNPIAAALRRARPGQIIEVMAGTYPGFTIGFTKDKPWNARTSGGQPGRPIIIRGMGGLVRIRPTDGSGDTIALSQAHPNGHFRFENLELIAGSRAAVMFFKASRNQVYDGFEFYDCDIVGGWDHVRKRGRNSKWGVWGHSLKNFVFAGRTRPATVTNIKREHAFYLQNAKGDITLENIQAARLGRTFCQFTARPGDGAPGVGTITVRNCTVEDACIAEGDGFKGGSAFTVAGRHTGTLIFENNTYRAGLNPAVAKLTRPGRRYGTGAFVAWDGGGAPNGKLVLRNNTFSMAPGTGDRPVVSIGGCREVRIEGTNRFTSGGREASLELDPMSQGKTKNTPNGKVYLSPTARLEGRVELRGVKATSADLAALAVMR